MQSSFAWPGPSGRWTRLSSCYVRQLGSRATPDPTSRMPRRSLASSDCCHQVVGEWQFAEAARRPPRPFLRAGEKRVILHPVR